MSALLTDASTADESSETAVPPEPGSGDRREVHVEPQEETRREDGDGFKEILPRRRRSRRTLEGTAAPEGVTWRLAQAQPPAALKALWVAGLDRTVSAAELWRLFEAKGVHPLRVWKLRFHRRGSSVFCVNFNDQDFTRCNRPEFFPAGVRFRRWRGPEPEVDVVRE